MLTDDVLLKLITPRKHTKNVLAIDSPGTEQGSTLWIPACAGLRSIAQNLIDEIDEHSHLMDAVILLLVKSSESIAKKLKSGEACVIGKASKANPQAKLLSRIKRKVGQAADFIIWLSGDWLDGVHATVEDGAECELTGELTDGLRKAVALIDHELSHCSAKIAGKYVDPAEVAGFVQDLGKRHIETCNDMLGEGGMILVRYYAKDPAGRYQYKMRRHDIEEFHGIVQRHGAWDLRLERLVDVIIENEPTLFSKS